MTSLGLISKLFLFVFIILLSIGVYKGVLTLPAEGDSINYHIPIAKNIISGNIFTQVNIINIERWYPGSSEILLSLFILLNIPLNLFNIVAIVFFAIILYRLGIIYLKNKNLSIIYSMSIVTLYGVFRLANTQNIDLWFVIYFLSLFMFLEKPEKKLSYFIKLGFFSGMLIGSKYTGPIFFAVLCIFYFKSLIINLSKKNILVFLIPFCFLGLFWYLRNLIITGSPVYPQSILFFKGLEGWHSYLNVPIWQAFIKTPILMMNAYISEMMLWPLLFISIPIFMLVLKNTDILRYRKINKKILAIPLICFVLYLFFPYDNKYEGMVLSVRYIFSVISLLALFIFILAKNLKIEKIISLLLLISLIPVFINPYMPKLIYLYVPFVFLIFFYKMFRNKLLKFKI